MSWVPYETFALPGHGKASVPVISSNEDVLCLIANQRSPHPTWSCLIVSILDYECRIVEVVFAIAVYRHSGSSGRKPNHIRQLLILFTARTSFVPYLPRLLALLLLLLVKYGKYPEHMFLVIQTLTPEVTRITKQDDNNHGRRRRHSG